MHRRVYMALHILLICVGVILLLLDFVLFSVAMGLSGAGSFYSDTENYRDVAVKVTELRDLGDLLVIKGTSEEPDSEILVRISDENYEILKESGVIGRILVGEELVLGVADGTVMTSFTIQCASLTHRGKTYLTYERGIAHLASGYREGALQMGIAGAVLAAVLAADCCGAVVMMRRYLKKLREESSQEYTPQFQQ